MFARPFDEREIFVEVIVTNGRLTIVFEYLRKENSLFNLAPMHFYALLINDSGIRCNPD
jgi:hypothetical protein